METFNLSYYFKQQCKFRLKDGKEVYGVIWADEHGIEKRYYFASANNHKLYEAALKTNNTQEVSKLIQLVDPAIIISAERIAC